MHAIIGGWASTVKSTERLAEIFSLHFFHCFIWFVRSSKSRTIFMEWIHYWGTLGIGTRTHLNCFQWILAHSQFCTVVSTMEYATQSHCYFSLYWIWNRRADWTYRMFFFSYMANGHKLTNKKKKLFIDLKCIQGSLRN